MTLRDKESWIRSILAHQKRHPPSTRSKYYLKNRKLVYGSIDPEKEQLLKGWEKHLIDVKEYFKDRKGDLLIMNIVGGDGWEQLCPFLKKDIPNVKFPHLNIMGSEDIKLKS